ncbi:N-acetyltransferase [Actinomadura sp. KC216]|uniref:GNAT family N-acetyltransferase n=1 Tax=Actinomadura sp. KC216 TaxID=2530370 RepID=UPI00104F9F88|nr:GNAT family N-acetyltransferase [Actinomadura sp. KC216]TDB91020.1 N-acetyltransferase [Actinomadura sp. KC216]
MVSRGGWVAVRSATPPDSPGIVEAAEHCGTYFNTSDYLIKSIPTSMEVLVAVDDDGSVLGYLEGSLTGNVAEDLRIPGCRSAFLFTIAVAREHQRSGVGRQLLEEFVRRARRAGFTALALIPRSGSPESMKNRTAFFLSSGLRCVNPQDPNEGMVGELDTIAPRLAATCGDASSPQGR